MNTPERPGITKPSEAKDERPVRTDPGAPDHDLTEEQEGQLADNEESLREEATRAHDDEQLPPVTREEGTDRRE